MARAVSTPRKALFTVAAWGVALLIAFPILWTILTSFKPEPQAVPSPSPNTARARLQRARQGPAAA